ETIQTAGGPQRMKVGYKRGVFQLLMTSRRPEAVQYKDQHFDILEEIEKDGIYIQDSMPEALRVRADEKFSYSKLKDFVMYADRKSTRLNSSHVKISYAVFCLKKKTNGLPRQAM